MLMRKIFSLNLKIAYFMWFVSFVQIGRIKLRQKGKEKNEQTFFKGCRA